MKTVIRCSISRSTSWATSSASTAPASAPRCASGIKCACSIRTDGRWASASPASSIKRVGLANGKPVRTFVDDFAAATSHRTPYFLAAAHGAAVSGADRPYAMTVTGVTSHTSMTGVAETPARPSEHALLRRAHAFECRIGHRHRRAGHRRTLEGEHRALDHPCRRQLQPRSHLSRDDGRHVRPQQHRPWWAPRPDRR